MGSEGLEAKVDGGANDHRLRVGDEEAGRRLDLFLHGRLGEHSRSWLKDLIKAGCVQVDGRVEKPSFKVSAGETVTASLRERPAEGALVPQDIPLEVVHEDATLLVISKPPQLVVHPGNGRHDGTLANALAHHFDTLSDVAGDKRPGIVHRLDRDTTGIMVVAKTNRAHFSLASQFQERTVEKEYLAILEGEMRFDQELVELPLGRSRNDPSKVTVDEEKGKAATTRFEVIERFKGYTFVRCLPKTGRTHQIRVHALSLGHPLVCDAVYGRRARIRTSDLGRMASNDPMDQVLLDRQALHAHRLAFFHPLEGGRKSFEAPLPEDMSRLLEALREHRPPRAKGG